MKNYDEVAESVFRRSKEVIKQNTKRRRTLTAIGSAASCLLIAGAVGFGVWRNSVRGTDMVLSGGQFANDGRDYRGASDTVVNHEHSVHEVASGDRDDLIGTIVGLDPPEYPELDETSGSGTLGNDTPGSANGPGYATSSSEPAQELPEETSGSGDISQSAPPCHQSVVQVVDSYPKISPGTYDAPANGTAYLSEPLKGAMEEYVSTNEDCLFYVTVDLYKDGECIGVDSAGFKEEWDRLCGHGFDCVYDTCAADEHHLSMLISREKLENFIPAEGYGYTLCLHGECEGGCVQSHCVQHAQNQSDQSSQSGHHQEHHNGDHC